MKLQRIILLLLTMLIGLSACNTDDDVSVELLPQEEQNQLDDLAIVKYLEDHYFNSVGKAVEFDEDNADDDNETALIDLAVQDDMGYWYVKNPTHPANGRQIQNVDNDSILIQYELTRFKATTIEDSVYYAGLTNSSIYNTNGSIALLGSTINGSGYPLWDPSFYYINESTLQEGDTKSAYEVEGIQDGLKHFYSSMKEVDELPAVDFQGLIIVPSRLAYERDRNAFNLNFDTSMILNFELYKVIDRE